MQLIRCTQKLLKAIGIKKADILVSDPAFSYLGSWHANLLIIDRKKCVLFTNDKTLINFIVPGIKKAQFKDLKEIFLMNLESFLIQENISDKTILKVLNEYSELNFSTTNSKTVLGAMNDLGFHYKHHILYDGGFKFANINEIIHMLNYMPMGPLKYRFSIDAFIELYPGETRQEQYLFPSNSEE